MPGTAVLCFQMILKIRVAEAPVVMIAAHSAYGISAAVLAAHLGTAAGSLGTSGFDKSGQEDFGNAESK